MYREHNLYYFFYKNLPSIWAWACQHCDENRLATWLWNDLFEWDWLIMLKGLRWSNMLLEPHIATEYVFARPWTWRKVFCRLAGHPCGGTPPTLALDPDGPCNYCGDVIYCG